MRHGRSNPWPAFADLLFMLFVTTLVAASVITTWAVRAEDKLKGCGAAEELVGKFQQCVGAERVAAAQACKVSIGENRLRFDPDKATLRGESKDYARQVGSCLVQLVDEALADDVIAERLDVISLDGFTDCVGDQMKNLRLGADRSATLFGYVVQAAEAEAWTPAHRADVLSRIAVRSFGKNRPEPGSPCASGPEKGLFREHAADRRVEISFQSRLAADG